MKKILVLFAILFTFQLSGYSQQYQIIEKKGKYGISKDNKVSVKPQYETIFKRNNNFFCAKKEGKYGIITGSGSIIVPLAYNKVEDFGSGLYLIADQNKLGLVDVLNKLILPIAYDKITEIDSYYCTVQSGNKQGLINKSGKLLIPAVYESISPFMTNSLLVRKDGKYGLINYDGVITLEPAFDNLELIKDFNFYCIKRNNKIGLIDTNGNIVLNPVYDSFDYSSPVGIECREGNKIGFYTFAGKIIKPIYDKILFYQSEFQLAVVKNGDKYAIVTGQGIETPAVYENISRFAPNGFAFVERSGKLMAINIEGQELTLQQIMGGGGNHPL